MRKRVFWIVVALWTILMGSVVVRDGIAMEINESIPDIYIKAINPGYTVDGKSNVGELIEIGRKESDKMTSLAGVTISYTNSSGNSATLVEFSEYGYMTSESMLLRLASSPDSELAAINYTKTLAMKGGLELMRGGEVIDRVCWTGKDECYKEFKSGSTTSLVRNLETGKYDLVKDYEPVYDKEAYWMEVVVEEEEEHEKTVSQCRGLRFSEILSYYESSKSEQFIELYNAGAEQILLDGCLLRYKNKDYALSGIVKPEAYSVYYPIEFSLTKNPVNENTLEIIDVDGAVVDRLAYPNGQRKGTAYAWIGYDEAGAEIWRVTYAPTPGGANNYQEFKTCEEGKVINEATGNCVKVTTVTTKVCPEGQYLNVLTGRCKKYEETTEKTCKEGYYLNPETGRCRKVVENNGADYSVTPEVYEERSSFVALYVVLGVVGVGIVYLGYEFRSDLRRLWQRVWRRFH